MSAKANGTQKQSRQNRTKRSIVFISHFANDDGDIAAKLKLWIETQYKTKIAQVFVSSSENDGYSENSIKSGMLATSEIGKNLKSFDVLISLLTPNSIKRPWVIFESGVGFGRGKHFIPILCRKLDRKSMDIHNPLKDLQVRSASKPEEFETILRELDKALGDKHTSIGVEELRKALCDPTVNAYKSASEHSQHGKANADNSFSDEIDHNEWSRDETL